MQLDRVTGAKCYTMSARALRVPSWGDTRRSSRWIHIEIDFIIGGKRFSEAAQFLGVRRLDISGKIRSKMLSENTAYAAYMVFKLGERLHRLDFPFQEASFKRPPPSVVRRSARCAGRFAHGAQIKQQQKWLMMQLEIAREGEVIGKEALQVYLRYF
ncbi:hypothetical protein ACQ4PT_034252 [Festuca glaucescens]